MPSVENARSHDGFVALVPIPNEEGGIVPPHSVLAPGTALRLLPQQSPVLRPGQLHCNNRPRPCSTIKKGSRSEPGIRPVVRSKLPCNLRSLPFGPTRRGTWMRSLKPEVAEVRLHDRVNGVALTARNSHTR